MERIARQISSGSEGWLLLHRHKATSVHLSRKKKPRWDGAFVEMALRSWAVPRSPIAPASFPDNGCYAFLPGSPVLAYGGSERGHWFDCFGCPYRTIHGVMGEAAGRE